MNRETVYKELHATINMSPAELRAWLYTDLAPITVANYPKTPSLDESKKWLGIVGKTVHELSYSDCIFAKAMIEHIAFLKRIKNRETHQKLDWENSLRNVGFDVKKKANDYRPLVNDTTISK